MVNWVNVIERSKGIQVNEIEHLKDNPSSEVRHSKGTAMNEQVVRVYETNNGEDSHKDPRGPRPWAIEIRSLVDLSRKGGIKPPNLK